MKLYDLFTKPGKKIAVLVDPDKPTDEQIIQIAKRSQESGVDFFFVGGSLLTNDNLDSCIKLLKIHSKIPVILFPGNTNQLSNKADGFLFLSLISGRNAEMLIGRHVIAAPYLKLSGLEILPTGYMLIDSGKPTSVSYMSNTVPIPNDKFDIAICTAMAGEMLGMKLIFLEGGSGAERSVSDEMIKMVHGSINIPLIVGGGIRTPERAAQCARAGADVIVIGNALEKEPGLLSQFADAVHGVI
jgi:putative glycerol-1-phosphate prenyltransferase